MKKPSDIIPKVRYDLQAHVRQVQKLWYMHPCTDEEALTELVERLTEACGCPRYLTTAVQKAIREIYINDELYAPEFPELTEEALTSAEQSFDPRRLEAAFVIIATLVACAHTHALVPDPNSTSIASVPFISTIKNARFFLDDLFYEFAQSREQKQLLFPKMSKQLLGNSRIGKGEDGFRNPIDDADPLELSVRTFLRGTPLLDLFLAPVPFAIETENRLGHMHVLAPTKTGKTRTLLHIIYQDIISAQPPAIVVIEPKNELVEPLSRLRCVQDRLLIVDPALMPPMNIFKLNSVDEDAAVEQYGYAFKASDMDVAGNQDLAIRKVARLMIRCGGNLSKFKKLLGEKGDLRASNFRKDICEFDDGTVGWFANNFFDTKFGVTKQALANKVERLTEASTLIGNMLEADDNVVDMAARINTPGSITLINTGGVPDEASEFLGRWFIAQTMAAAKRRTKMTRAERLQKPVYLFIDEAQTYFSADMTKILEGCRSMGLGIILSHQNMAQLDDIKLRGSVLSEPITRIARPNTQDRGQISHHMRTSSEHLSSLQTVPGHHSEFGVHVRDVTENAITIAFPHTTVENADRLSRSEYAALLDRLRYSPPPKPRSFNFEREPSERKPKAKPAQPPAGNSKRQRRDDRDKDHTEPTDY